jgi:hypothetical protein
MKNAKAIIAAVLATAAATPANVRRDLEAWQASFVNLRGFQITQSGQILPPAAKNIKNTVGKELEAIEAQLVEISIAFDKLIVEPKMTKQTKYLLKVGRLMNVNIGNNPKWEKAKYEALRKEANEKAEAAKAKEIAAKANHEPVAVSA